MKVNGNVSWKALITVLGIMITLIVGGFTFWGNLTLANDRERVREDKDIRECFYTEVKEIRQEQAIFKGEVQQSFKEQATVSTQILVQLGKIEEQIKNGQNNDNP